MVNCEWVLSLHLFIDHWPFTTDKKVE